MKHLSKIAVALVPFALVPRVARGQRETFTQWNAWFSINGDVALNDRWGVLFDGSIRRSGPLDEAQANFVRGGLAYELSDHVRIAAGANWSRTYPYGKVPISYATTERRTWQQLILTQSVGRLDLAHRYRLEQRFRGRRDDPLVDHVDHWEGTGRFRYQLRGTVPLRGARVEPGDAYFTFADELFVSFGGHVEYNIFDQNRATAALGFRLTRDWRTEVGFLEQTAFKGNGQDVERNHTLTVSLGYSRAAPKPRS